MEVLNLTSMRELPEYIVNHGIDVFSTKEKFEKWLQSCTRAFGMKRVIDQSDEDIDMELGRIEWGVLS